MDQCNPFWRNKNLAEIEHCVYLCLLYVNLLVNFFHELQEPCYIFDQIHFDKHWLEFRCPKNSLPLLSDAT